MTIAPDRRQALLDQMADHVLVAGLAAASLRSLAKAAGTSDRMLLYYFPDKAVLIAAVLETVAARIAGLLIPPADPNPQPFDTVRIALTSRMLDPASWPYMRLWLELASRAAAGDPVCRQTGEKIARDFLALAFSLVAAPDDTTRRRDAARLLIAIEGAVLLKSLGLEDAVAETL